MAIVYSSRIREHGHKLRASFVNYDMAFEWLKARNIELNLPISNIIHDMGDYYEVELTHGQRGKFDIEDIDIIQRYCLCAHFHPTAHVVASVENKCKFLHNLIMNHELGEITVDHINRDGLDNRKINLRLATKREQVMNRGLSKNNTSGIVGVQKSSNGKDWVAS